MKKAYRINSPSYYKDENFEKHIEFVKQNIDTIDEVALFFDYCHHAYMPENEIRERCDVIKERIKVYRTIGVKSVGINVLNTIGQTEEAWEFMQPSPFQTMVGYEGFVSKACFCPSTKEYEDYITLKYKLIAETEPDFIWLDDDMRMKNHGSQFPCFCENCLRIFNEKHGYRFDRESLVEKLNSKDGKEVRGRWIDFNHEKLYGVAKLCEKAIHSVNPSIITGLMGTGREGRWYSDYNANTLLAELKGNKARTGGGVYNDECPTRLIHGITAIQRQTVLFSPEVTDIQHEYETYPHLKLGKSDTFTDLEIVNAIMAGCNGIAFNNGPHDRKNVADLIRKKRGLYDLVCEKAFPKKTEGVYTLYTTNYPKRKNVDGDFFIDYDLYDVCDATNAMAEIGIPQTGNLESSDICVLVGRMADGYSDDELLELLSGNIMMDGYAANSLIERGFSEYIGVSAPKVYESGISEHYNSHLVNGEYAGHERTIAITFFHRGNKAKCSAFAFEANEGAEVISDLYSILDEKLGVCGALFKNSLGGRVAVIGYAAFAFLKTEEKREQLFNICDWMTDGKFSVRIQNPLKVMPIMRSDENESIICLSNCWFDNTEEFAVDIRKENVTSVCEILNDGTLIPVKFEKIQNGIRMLVDNILPWNYRVYNITMG